MKKLTSILITLLLTASAAFAGIGGPPYNPKNVGITGGAINGTPVGATTPSSGAFTVTNTTQATSLAGVLMESAVAPTIASGFGTSPSIGVENGTAAFTVSVGTGGTASSGVITMPAAANGWACDITNNANQANAWTRRTSASTATSLAIANYLVSTGALVGWGSGAVLIINCTAY